MEHEKLPPDLLMRAKFAALVATLAHGGPSSVISTALKTLAPNHMIDAQLPNLWRY